MTQDEGSDRPVEHAGVGWTSGLLFDDKQLATAREGAQAADAADGARLAGLRGNMSLPLVFLGAPFGTRLDSKV